ncbi:MAG: hypothetical protein EBU90_27130, partial [Proteobacteria bacterium]|nr:hypothetical protein [Pseudomonadota bacterium]
MRYFSNFPKLITSDGKGNVNLSTNLLARVNLVPNLIKNPSLFYRYTMQDGDNPEIIASKYYDNPYRYWIFLYGNNIIDPQWDLALAYRDFEAYLDKKYYNSANANNQTAIAYTQSTTKYYKKIITTYDSVSDSTTISKFIVDANTYSNLPSNIVTTRYFSPQKYVTVTESKETQNIYDYELEENESKREVNIINNSYAISLEDRLKS